MWLKRLFSRRQRVEQVESEDDLVAIERALYGLVNVTLANLGRQHPTVKAFLGEHVSRPNTVAALAAEKMQLTLQENCVHSAGLATDQACFLMIHTIPVAEESAAEWYQREWGGYLKFLEKPLNNPVITTRAVLLDFIFGVNQDPPRVSFWLTTCLCPLRKEHANLLGWWGFPGSLLSEEEKRAIL